MKYQLQAFLFALLFCVREAIIFPISHTKNRLQYINNFSKAPKNHYFDTTDLYLVN
jgi:hypothetical protein